jgi:hypothetical protein
MLIFLLLYLYQRNLRNLRANISVVISQITQMFKLKIYLPDISFSLL